MKKSIVIFIVMILLCGAMSAVQPVAAAGTDSPKSAVIKTSTASEEAGKIRALVEGMEGVAECAVIAYGDNVAVAIRTKGIFLASQERKIKIEIEKKIKESFPQYNNIFVLTRIKDFYSLKGLEAKLDEGANPLDIYKTLIEMYKKPKNEQKKKDNNNRKSSKTEKQ